MIMIQLIPLSLDFFRSEKLKMQKEHCATFSSLFSMYGVNMFWKLYFLKLPSFGSLELKNSTA